MIAFRDHGVSWHLNWRDPINSDQISLGVSDGSCQQDSQGLGPGIVHCSIRSGSVNVEASIDFPTAANTVDVTLTITNRAEKNVSGRCRLLLNSG